MEQENANGKIEGKPKKQSWIWITLGSLALGLCTFAFVFKLLAFPQNTMMPIEGTVVILDENGEPLPFQAVRWTCFSHFAPGSFRNDRQRTQSFFGQPEKFNRRIPKFAATLFVRTEDGKHAAIVDITPDKPPIGLVVELRPLYTATGRLLDRQGAPLVNQSISFKCRRSSDFGYTFAFGEHGIPKTLHFSRATTDSEGFFTIDNIIPGTEHVVFIGNRYATSLDMPILEPEQYQEPFDLGDVSIR